MSAAAFVLAINLFIAAIFATSFGVVAAYRRSAVGARWLAFGYSAGIIDVLLEFILPFQQDPRLVSFGIFVSFLVALTCCVIGLAIHFKVTPPWATLGAAFIASMVLNFATLDMPRDDLTRNFLYQAPYALIQAFAVIILLRTGSRRALDIALTVLLTISSLQFLAKPFLAVALGSGEGPQDYLGSTYAAISQSLAAMLLIANGLLMLLVIVRDVMAEMTIVSETDALSGLLNRRGFEDQAEKALGLSARAGRPAAIVVADLDQFKHINDSYGHATGDQVIVAFARILEKCTVDEAVLARLGGEEFVAFLPGLDLLSGKLQAETIRSAFSSLSAETTGLPYSPTASLGVAQLLPGERLSDLLRRADAALYQAKTDGRNRVQMAGIGSSGPRLATVRREAG
jgi:diguanylate cyclase (GGDEF)-like protein